MYVGVQRHVKAEDLYSFAELDNQRSPAWVLS